MSVICDPLGSHLTLILGVGASVFETLLGAFLLPAPFTFWPFAPCSFEFFQSCSLLIFNLLPFHFSLLPAPTFSQYSQFFCVIPKMTEDDRIRNPVCHKNKKVKISLFRYLDLPLVCSLLPFTDKIVLPDYNFYALYSLHFFLS